MLLIWSIFSDDPDIMVQSRFVFEKFNNMPFWYQALFIGVVSAFMVAKIADIIESSTYDNDRCSHYILEIK